MIQKFANALLDGEVPAAMRTALEQYLKGKDKEGKAVAFKPTREALDEKVRGVVRLMLSSPEYQLA